MGHQEEVQPPLLSGLCTVVSWMWLFGFGHLRDFVRKRLLKISRGSKDFAPIRQDYEDFYTRRCYYRLHDNWNRPICSAPDAWIDVMERSPVNGQKPLKLTGRTLRCMNLGSYNYLGFAAADEYCTPRVLDCLGSLGWAACSSRADIGTTQEHLALEELVAEFVVKEDALTFGMGFATNSLVIPALVGKGCLVISDALNHASIVAGVRGSGAKVKVFAHNDAVHLEAVLRASIAEGQPRTHRPWKKILIIVEGIYSMEGEMCRLAEIIAVKKKYKAYLFLDEAHSIGALGKSGRGCTEWSGVDPADVDIMMGTFTKSFGSYGGYIAGSRELIRHLREHSPAHLAAGSMSPPAAVQTASALRVIMGRDGTTRGAAKLAQLRDNSNYMRSRLTAMGCLVLGDYDSPVLPLMLYQPMKIAACSRLCLERNLAIVVVGFPAVPLMLARTRLCISAAHTRKDIDWALDIMEEVAEKCLLHYRKPTIYLEPTVVADITAAGEKIKEAGLAAIPPAAHRLIDLC